MHRNHMKAGNLNGNLFLGHQIVHSGTKLVHVIYAIVLLNTREHKVLNWPNIIACICYSDPHCTAIEIKKLQQNINDIIAGNGTEK